MPGSGSAVPHFRQRISLNVTRKASARKAQAALLRFRFVLSSPSGASLLPDVSTLLLPRFMPERLPPSKKVTSGKGGERELRMANLPRRRHGGSGELGFPRGKERAGYRLWRRGIAACADAAGAGGEWAGTCRPAAARDGRQTAAQSSLPAQAGRSLDFPDESFVWSSTSIPCHHLNKRD